MNKRYELTKETLGDVFEDKVIHTDSLDLIGYILKEVRDPVTGNRRYKKVPHTYSDEKGETHNNIWDPPLPILKLDMDLIHPPGRYVIKVVNAYNKSISYGSITFYNKGEDYLMLEEDTKRPTANANKPAMEIELKKLRAEVRYLKEVIARKKRY
jgi:hypothetical protein